MSVQLSEMHGTGNCQLANKMSAENLFLVALNEPKSSLKSLFAFSVFRISVEIYLSVVY